jgi:carboxymethylenebutenolidase
MGQMTKLTASDGYVLAAYKAEPKGTPRGGLVVIQEIWGINNHIQSVAAGFAAAGYLAVAPALFDRVEPGLIMHEYNSETTQRGMEAKNKVDQAKALLDIDAAVEEASAGGKVGVVGYCFGGRMAWLAASRVDGVSASVSYYGGGIPGLASEQPRCPVMLHFGEKDSMIPVDQVEEFRKAHPTLPIHIYPADHGFNCDQRPSYDAESARKAGERTLEFLREHVG